MTDEPLRAPPEDRLAPSPAGGFHTRPLGGSSPRPRWQTTWSGFLLGAVILIVVIGLVTLLWRGIEGGTGLITAPMPALTEAELQEIETLLDQLGFPPGAADGAIDAEAEAAIRDFQVTAGLPVDGAPSAALLEELRAAMAELGG